MFTKSFQSKMFLCLFVLLAIVISLLGTWNISTARAQSGTTDDGNTPVESPILEPVTDPQQLSLASIPETDAATALALDTRTRMTPTTSAPWNNIAKIVFTYPNGSQKICTGFFIGPYTVATAGHCVYDVTRKVPGGVSGWATQASVYPATDAGVDPYGFGNGYQLYSTTGWTENKDPLYDYGAVYLTTPLGNPDRWFNYAYFSDSYLNTYFAAHLAYIAGYPLDKDALCKDINNNVIQAGCLWYDSGSIPGAYITPSVFNYSISTDADVSPNPLVNAGQDGSPIWIDDAGSLYAIGINLFSPGDPLCMTGKNCGLRITNAIATNLYTWSSIMPLTDPMGAGVYDDAASSWLYTGTWSAWSGTGPYNNTLHFSGAPGSTATFAFTGTQFTLKYTASTNRGNLDIYVDNVFVTTLNEYSATVIWQKTWTSPTYSPVSHTVKFVNASAYTDIDAIIIPDTVPPAAITDLAASTGPVAASVSLTWTAPGDDDLTGIATSYLVRYSPNPISDETAWNAATAVTNGVPTPSGAMTSQSMIVYGLVPGNTYYFAIRARDEASNLGGLSNSPSAQSKDATPVGLGTYDDTDYNFIYSGAWTAWSGVGPYLNTVHFTNVPGNSATIAFNGARFTLLYTASANRGNLDVYVDGNKIATLNEYSATATWQKTWTSPAFVSGIHTVQFVNASAYTDIDAIVIQDITPVGAGTYDDTDINWAYSGTWTAWSGSGPYLNTLHFINVPGASASMTFSGTGFALTYTASANRGNLDIYVDSVKITTLNEYNATAIWQKTWTSPTFAFGTHIVQFVNVSAYTDIDAITIQGPVSPGIYDDANTNFSYSGTWTAWSGTGPYLNTLHFTNTPGNAATIMFTGIRFTLLYTASANRGNLDIYVDSVKVATLNEYSATANWQTTWSSPTFASGAHTVQFVNVSAYTDIDAILIQDAVSPGKYDDTNVNFLYSSAWTTWSGSGPYLNTVHFTNTPGASVSITFNGTNFILTYTASASRGNLDIYVDSVMVATLNEYSPTTTWQKTWSSPTFASGVHTVQFVNASAYTDIDAIVIQNIVPVGSGTYDDTNVNFIYSGAWTAWSGSGPYLNTLHFTNVPGASASITFTGTSFILMYTASTNRGNLDIYVDGVKVTTLNEYNATAIWQKTWTSPTFTSGTHIVQFVNVSAYTDVDAIMIVP